MEKDFVSMEQQVCLVCGNQFDTGCILLDSRLRPSMERTTVTGIGLCPEHQKLHDDGFIALVAVDPARSSTLPDGSLDPTKAYRLGPIVHLKREAAKRIIKLTAELHKPMLFAEAAVIELLCKMRDESAQ